MSTKIEWADVTWNPITGCTPISEGCANCYAKRMATRLRGRYGYPEDEPFKVVYHPDRINVPYKWKKSRKIFVNSMGDLFIKGVQGEWLENVWDTMFDFHPELNSMTRHIFLILTKRPNNIKIFEKWMKDKGRKVWYPHIWLGVTAENQKRFDERWPIVSQISASIKFVSIEPALSFVSLKDVFGLFKFDNSSYHTKVGSRWKDSPDWVIWGPETGPKRRPYDPQWAKILYAQCKAAGVPFFDKRKTGWIAREFPK